MRRPLLSLLLALATSPLLAGCNGDASDGPPVDDGRWRTLSEGPGGAILCVWGTSADDVYAVGGDPGTGSGPVAFRLDRGAWTAVPTEGAQDALWWVFGPADDAVYLVGAGGTILRHDPGAHTTTREDTPLGDDATLIIDTDSNIFRFIATDGMLV